MGLRTLWLQASENLLQQKMMIAKAILFALLAERAIAREVLGAIHLDAYTFDKVVAYHDVFLKFDKYIPYGPKEDAFRELAKQVGELSTDLLIGWIGVQDYGDELNADLARRFKVEESDMPKYALFRKGGDDVTWYTDSALGSGDLLAWLSAEYGLYVSGLEGCTEEGDAAAKEFMAASPDARGGLMAAFEKEVEAMDQESVAADMAGTYVKIMKKVIEKGAEYIAAEKARVTKLIDGKVSGDKKGAFKRRLNVLGSFVA